MYKCKCGREFEKKSSLISHGGKCKLYEKKKKKTSKYKVDNMYVCECGKEFNNHQSLNAHFSHCKIHRNGKEPKSRWKESCCWNKGLTKETSESVKKYAKTLTGRTHFVSDETKRRISEATKGKNGGYREGCNHWRGVYTKDLNGNKIWLDSSYELLFVNIMNKHNIKWHKNKKEKFPYVYENVKRNYIPDFYLEEIDIWVEVKGYEKEIDLYKWKYFPHKLKIIRYKDLLKLDDIINKNEVMAELVYAQG